MNNTLRNRVQLIGNLGAAPEIKIFDGNKKVAKLSIATTEKYKNQKGEWVSDTTWHYLTAWGNQAEFAEKFLVKGSEIAIEGKLKNSTYTDKEQTYLNRYTGKRIYDAWKKEFIAIIDFQTHKKTLTDAVSVFFVINYKTIYTVF
jgi:single-strand DNA-binding protein